VDDPISIAFPVANKHFTNSLLSGSKTFVRPLVLTFYMKRFIYPV